MLRQVIFLCICCDARFGGQDGVVFLMSIYKHLILLSFIFFYGKAHSSMLCGHVAFIGLNRGNLAPDAMEMTLWPSGRENGEVSNFVQKLNCPELAIEEEGESQGNGYMFPSIWIYKSDLVRSVFAKLSDRSQFNQGLSGLSSTASQEEPLISKEHQARVEFALGIHEKFYLCVSIDEISCRFPREDKRIFYVDQEHLRMAHLLWWNGEQGQEFRQESICYKNCEVGL